MSVLPRASGRAVVKALVKIGYAQDRQRGSHIILRQVTYPHRRIVVPDYREVSKGTLKTIIRQAGLTVEEFKALLWGDSLFDAAPDNGLQPDPQ